MDCRVCSCMPSTPTIASRLQEVQSGPQSGVRDLRIDAALPQCDASGGRSGAARPTRTMAGSLPRAGPLRFQEGEQVCVDHVVMRRAAAPWALSCAFLTTCSAASRRADGDDLVVVAVHDQRGVICSADSKAPWQPRVATIPSIRATADLVAALSGQDAGSSPVDRATIPLRLMICACNYSGSGQRHTPAREVARPTIHTEPEKRITMLGFIGSSP